MNDQMIIVATALIKRGNEILLLLRDEEIMPGAHIKWELPGGKIDFGEKPEETVAREVLEETGYIVKPKRMIPYIHTNIWNYPDHKKHVIVLCYESHLIGGQPNLNDHKTKDLKWVDINNLKEDELLPGIIKFINLVRV